MKIQRLLRATMACIVVFVCGNAIASENPGDSLVPDFYNDPTLSTSGIRLEDFESSSVDYFSGMMSRSATDFSLPGNGGMALSFRRSYNSQQPYSWPEHTAVGVGWNMHFGWVEIADAGKLCDPVWNVSVMDNPVLHMPDGSTDVLAMTDAPMLDPTAVHYRSKGGMGLICNAAYGSGAETPFILVGPDGTRYEFERWSGGGQVVGFFRTAKWFVKKITDRHGNWIWIDYADVGSYEAGTYTGRVVAPTRVTTSDARDVVLEYQDGLLQRILYGAQPVVEYAYQPAGLNGSIEDFRNLVTVTLREQLVWNYQYSAYGDPGAGSMTKVTNPFGGVTVYTWRQQYFQSGDGQQLNSAVTRVVQSESDYNDTPPATAAIWNYNYVPATAIGQRDVTTVAAPEGVYQYTHFSAVGMVSGEVWKVGLKERVVFTPVSGPVKTEEFTWTPYIISYENNKRTSASGLYAAVDQEYYGSVLSLHVTRIGSAEWRTTSADWAWDLTYLGTPQAQTITTRGPDGTERVLNRRYQHREPMYVYFLLHQEFFIQQLHPGYTPMNVEFNELGDAVEKFEKGFTTFLTYDAQGNLETMTRGLNRERTEGVARVTSFSDYYLGVARLTTHPDTTTTVLEVDPLGRTVRKTDRDGRIMAYAYDQLGRIRHIDYPAGNDTFLTYDGRTTRLDRGNYRRTTAVDGFGRNVEESHADTASGRDIRVTRRYDSQGRTEFTSFPNSTQGTHYQYDDYGRVTRATHPGGYRSYLYVDGSHVDVTDENGNTTRLIRDEVDGAGKGELVRIESPEGVVTTIVRNEYGLPLRIEQGDGVNNVVRTNSYNASLVLLDSHDPEKAREYYFYDYAGNVKDIFHELDTGGTGRVQHNEYDLNDRVVSTTAPLNTLAWDGYEDFYSVELTFSYTAEGKPVDQTRSDSITRLQGGVTQVYSGGSYSTWHHEYDANGNLRLERLTAPDVEWQFQYTYDANDRLATVTYPGNEVVAYQPDAFGWPTQAGVYATGITYHETGQLAGFTYGNGRQASIAVNDRYLVESMVVPGISDLAYDYDAAGNVLSITDARDATQNVTLRYDGMNRMTGADGAWGVGTFAYDATGNILQKTLGSDSLAMSYDPRNRLASITGSRNRQYSYDLFGNIAHRDGQSFGYDGLGNLLFQVGTGISGETRYQYDARGRRLATVKNGERQYSLYANGDRLMYEANPSADTWQRNIYVGALLVARSEKFIACYDDVDGDGIPYCAEQEAGMDPYNPLDAAGDRDGDGLTNLDEYQRGTGINDADTDDDGIGDGLEVSFGMDPKVDDAGGDLDGDGLPNNVELARGFDPANPADGAADADTDGLSNAAEYTLGTAWNDADSDNDGMNDGYESGKGLNPLLDDRAGDRDGDGLPNFYEFERGLDPANAADAAADAEGDGLTNLEEYLRGTNPLVADTDGDGMGDGEEVANGRNPLLNDNTIDTDGDGLPDTWEIAHGLDPNSSFDAMTDHDGDGDQTGSEYRAGADPFVAELPTPPDDILAIPDDGKTWVTWHRDPLAGTYNIDWGVVGESGKQTVAALSMTYSAPTANDTLYWFQASATRGQYLVPGRRITSVGGPLVDGALPETLETTCERSQLGVAGRDAYFVACEQGGMVTVYRHGPGVQPVPQTFPTGAQQNGKSGWRFASALNGDALFAWLEAETNTLTGARYDAFSGLWLDAIALEDRAFAVVTSGSPNYSCRDGDQDYLKCRYGEIYAFDVQSDAAEGLYAAYAVNIGYASDGVASYAFERIRVPLARLTYWTDPFGHPMPEPRGGLQPVRLAFASGRPALLMAVSPEEAVVMEEKAGGYRVKSLAPSSDTDAGYVLGAVSPASAGLSADRGITGWLNAQAVYGARGCGGSCQPMTGSIEASTAPTSYAFGGIGDGQVFWHAPGAIRYSSVVRSAKGVYSWGRAANLVTDALLTNPAWIRFARGEKSASLYWSNSAGDIRATHIKADGTWTAPVLQPLTGNVADLGSDWAGNLVVAVSADGSYRFRERRRVPSGTDYSADTTPPVLSHSSTRSGKTTITQVVTLTADEPANRFFTVTGGTITAGGANTTAEQRYTGPVTITFPKGSSATITYRGINMAERWSNPVSVVLQ